MQALATVTNEEYIEGTEVLFLSFLQNNPEFKGDLVVIHDSLSTSLQSRLSLLFPVRFVEVSRSLKQRVESLVKVHSHYQNRFERFWSLEVFNLKGYDKVLFMDSDILCRGNLSPVLELEVSFAAAPDVGSYKGEGRNPITFEKVTKVEDSSDATIRAFNAGVFFFRPRKLQINTFNELLDLVSANVFEQVTSGHTDQYVLNRHFNGLVHWLDSQYNYLIRRTDLIKKVSVNGPLNAPVWHYIRQPKPWKLKQLIKRKLTQHPELTFWIEWHKIYRLVIQKKIKTGRGLSDIINWTISYIFAR